MKDNLIQKGLEQDARWIKERILMGAKFEKTQEAAKNLKAFLVEHNWTQAGVAAKLGVSTAVINQFLQDKYKGNTDELVNKVINLLNSLDRKERQHKKKFIETAVAKEIFTLIVQTEACTEDEGKIGVVIGESGHGKSECLKAYAKANKNSIYIELDGGMNSTTLFSALADKLGLYTEGSLAVITRRVIDYLQNRHIILILDEASDLKIKQLSLLRQIVVIKCHCPLILSGNAALYKTIMRPPTRHGAESLDQFTSRLMQICNLDNQAADKSGGLYTPEDIRKLYEYDGIRLTKDAVNKLKSICKTPLSGKLHICNVVIKALHTSGVVNKTKQITAQNIDDAIDQLNLPVRDRLAVHLPEVDDEQKTEEKKKTA